MTFSDIFSILEDIVLTICTSMPVCCANHDKE